MNTSTLISAIRKLEGRAITRPLLPKEERQLSLFFEEAYDKLLYTPSKEFFGTSKVIGKHKLPRYMYHLTTEENYLSMLKDGSLKPSQCMDSSVGTFLFDIKNFTRFWRKTPDVAEQPRTTLLNMIAGKLGFETQGNLVLLRVPTNILDARTLRLRRQKLCRIGLGNVQKEQEAVLNDKFKFSNALECLKYTMQGENVSQLPLYNQRKEAIEFITSENIPIDKITLVGTARVDTKLLNEAHINCHDVPSIWRTLTKNQPEQKAFNVMV